MIIFCVHCSLAYCVNRHCGCCCCCYVQPSSLFLFKQIENISKNKCLLIREVLVHFGIVPWNRKRKWIEINFRLLNVEIYKMSSGHWNICLLCVCFNEIPLIRCLGKKEPTVVIVTSEHTNPTTSIAELFIRNTFFNIKWLTASCDVEFPCVRCGIYSIFFMIFFLSLPFNSKYRLYSLFDKTLLRAALHAYEATQLNEWTKRITRWNKRENARRWDLSSTRINLMT